MKKYPEIPDMKEQLIITVVYVIIAAGLIISLIK